MDKIKEKVQQLRSEIDASNQRAESAEKKLESIRAQAATKGIQSNLNDDVTSWEDIELQAHQAKSVLLEEQIAATEQRFEQVKQQQAEGEILKGQTDGLQRKVQMLETANNKVANNLKEVLEKAKILDEKCVEIQAKSNKLEEERETLEQESDELSKKYNQTKQELEQTLASLEAM